MSVLTIRVMLMSFAGAATNEAVAAIRFTPDDTHTVMAGYLHYVDGDGFWQQRGVIRFRRVSDGTLRQTERGIMRDAAISFG